MRRQRFPAKFNVKNRSNILRLLLIAIMMLFSEVTFGSDTQGGSGTINSPYWRLISPLAHRLGERRIRGQDVSNEIDNVGDTNGNGYPELKVSYTLQQQDFIYFYRQNPLVPGTTILIAASGSQNQLRRDFTSENLKIVSDVWQLDEGTKKSKIVVPNQEALVWTDRSRINCVKKLDPSPGVISVSSYLPEWTQEFLEAILFSEDA
jgi:hypothetical protein